MSNMLTEFEMEVRGWTDDELAQAIDNLNNSRDHKRLYTGVQKLAIRAEASRRLRWGRKSEKINSFPFVIYGDVEAEDPDEAKDSMEQVLRETLDRPTGVRWHFETIEIVS